MFVALLRWEVVLFVLLNLCAGLAFVINIKKTLELLHSRNLTVSPKKVWYLLIPGINIIFHFIMNKKVAQSLYNEFEYNQWNTRPIHAAYNLGIVTGIFNILMLLPFGGVFFWFAFTVLFFSYWVGLFLLRQFISIQTSDNH